MAALVQTYPQQTSTVTMLQARPSSSGGAFPQQHAASRGQQMPRYSPSSSGSYRGLPSSGLVAPYAFTTTPQLTNNAAFLQNATSPHLRPQHRALSAPNLLLGTQQPLSGVSGLSARQRFAASSPSASSSSSNSLQPGKKSMDDASITTRETSVDVPARPKSTLGLSSSSSMQLAGSLASPKPSPDRYRRGSRLSPVDSTNNSGPNRVQAASASPSGSGMLAVGQLYSNPALSQAGFSAHNLHTPQNERSDPPRLATTDDLNVSRPRGNAEHAQRYRRRSVGSFDAVGDLSKQTPPMLSPQMYPNRGQLRDRRQSPDPQRPVSAHAHQGSSDSITSIRSTKSNTSQQSTRRDHAAMTGVAVAGPMHATSVSKQEVKLINVPPRPDTSKRSTIPSPLSQPSDMTEPPLEPSVSTPVPSVPSNVGSSKPNPPNRESPAAQQLAAINKDSKKKSKLRRAFSFGSASELRRASAQNNIERNVAAEKSTKRNSKFEDEMDPEQAKIAQKQEAGGLGESIYSGQGNFFTGSTDNLSIQSSASSASIMLRKMGKGVKKSTRSIVGLFRPKSVIGVPAADSPVMTGTAQVSMVTVEAEREKVNVNVNPHDQPGGGTGFPKLERNSIDAGISIDARQASNDARPRRSIVGGEKERAEVLAAVKKGILKRTDSGQSSPTTTPKAYRAPDFNLPQIPHLNDSPSSTEPSTPSDGVPPRSGHRRTDSVTIEGDSDYFSSITQFAALQGTGSTMTPNGSMVRNISFSPRIQFHDTWPSIEYDRRGDTATCNRLTPMLAQQIKEELNTFKMEMEVHESSKVYTHFF